MKDIDSQIPLSSLTTFQIGGPARYLVEIKNVTEIGEAIEYARHNGLAFSILGGGSNVLASDSGFDGLIIRIAGGEAIVSGLDMQIGAGCNLWETIIQSSQSGLGGWEMLAGIPGTMGGAIRGNAGAFGMEIKDVVVSVEVLHRETLETKQFQKDECDFAYRTSFFKTHPEWIIVSAQVRLAQVEASKSGELIRETIHEREKRHLQNVRSAGSYFTNPVAPRDIQEMFEKEKNSKSKEGRVPAGWLIEKIGMKGARVGDAEASEQHPNYLKNNGKATAADVRELARLIKEQVKEKYGIQLQEEAALLE